MLPRCWQHRRTSWSVPASPASGDVIRSTQRRRSGPSAKRSPAGSSPVSASVIGRPSKHAARRTSDRSLRCVVTSKAWRPRLTSHPRPSEHVPVVLAALRPRMLELAATAADGAHPYFVPVEHTARAREDPRSRQAARARARCRARVGPDRGPTAGAPPHRAASTCRRPTTSRTFDGWAGVTTILPAAVRMRWSMRSSRGATRPQSPRASESISTPGPTTSASSRSPRFGRCSTGRTRRPSGCCAASPTQCAICDHI